MSKRAAQHQLTRDNFDDDDGRDSDEFETTPQIADAAELAGRRMVTVKRSAAPPSAAGSSLFKGFPSAPAPAGPSSGFAPVSTSAAPLAKPFFGFGAPPSSEAPKFSFNFGAPATGQTATTTTTTAAPALSFGFPAAGAAADVGTPAEAPKFAFGSGTTFNFGAAVGSFTEGQKKLSEAKDGASAPAEGGDKAADANGSGSDEDDTPKLFAGKSSIATVSGEVLAAAPSKLYNFDKAGNSWKESGEGDAKVKKDTLPADEGKEEQTIYRLMVRDGYSLNALIVKDSFVLTKEAEKHIIFSVATPEGVETHLLKFTGPAAETNTNKILGEIKKVIA